MNAKQKIFLSFTIQHYSFAIKHVFFRIDDADYRAVGRRVVAPEREARLLAAAPDDQLAHARADRVERDERLSFRRQIGVQSLHNQKFAPFERFIFNRRNEISDNAS